jgi:hypothetical protein
VSASPDDRSILIRSGLIKIKTDTPLAPPAAHSVVMNTLTAWRASRSRSVGSDRNRVERRQHIAQPAQTPLTL